MISLSVTTINTPVSSYRTEAFVGTAVNVETPHYVVFCLLQLSILHSFVVTQKDLESWNYLIKI